MAALIKLVWSAQQIGMHSTLQLDKIGGGYGNMFHAPWHGVIDTNISYAKRVRFARAGLFTLVMMFVFPSRPSAIARHQEEDRLPDKP